MAAASGRLSELMITNPNPSLSFLLMMTSLGCAPTDVLSEEAAALAALGDWAAAVLLPYAKSLRGELCCVETEPGLRPFSGQESPAGGDRALAEIYKTGSWTPDILHLSPFPRPGEASGTPLLSLKA